MFSLNRLYVIVLSALLAHAFCNQAFAETGPTTELGDQWIRVPTCDGAPSFRYQIEPQDQAVHYHILLDQGTDERSWYLHAWFADPRMVEARKKLLVWSKDEIKEKRKLLADKEHQDANCQMELKSFLKGAEIAQRKIRDYDPFNQAALLFQGTASGAQNGIETGTLALQKAKDGTAYYVGGFQISKDMDLASLELPKLTYKLIIASIQNPKRRPIAEKDLSSLPLETPWDLTDQLAESQMILSQFHEVPKKLVDGRVYLADAAGYHEAEVASVAHPACFGVEGNFLAPGLWAVIPEPKPLKLIRPDEELSIYGLGPRLLVAWKGNEKHGDLLDLRNHLNGSAEVEGGWQILDNFRDDTGLYLLLQASNFSRPGSPSSYCGGGDETNLLWLRLAGATLAGLNCDLIESCFESIEPSRIPKRDLNNGLWTWAWDVIRDHANDPEDKQPIHSVTYDPKHPKRGIEIEEAPKPLWERRHGKLN